ncbi:hypothetical protein [Chromohalobacter israelensis]|uniref:hypothetical protein n=1 Tax=Chromohalobacter israelensis TaxID=141390 RepID=UPI0016512F94|nr:hypothetical protein [Chromohalobacter salexigens]
MYALIAHPGHNRFVAFDRIGDTVGEVQLVIVADLGVVQVVEPAGSLGQVLLLGIVGLA